MKKVIPIIIAIILSACNETKDKTSIEKKDSQNSNIVEQNKKIETDNKELELVQLSKNCDESFDDFFERFSRDSVFQKSRVKYPIEESYIENLESTEIKVDIINNPEEYTFIDFTEDENAFNKELDKYRVIIEKLDKENVYYKNDGIDNGINIIYKFKLIEGCWYMVEIEDKST